MRFGKQLKSSIVPAWRTKYVRYGEIKAKIKELKLLYEAHNVPVIESDTARSSFPLPGVINANTTIIKMDRTNMGPTRLPSAMEGSMESRKSDTDLEDCHPIGVEPDDDIKPVGDIMPKSNDDKCRFRDVAKVIESEGRLASKVPRSCSQEIRLKEKEIALMLEQDLYTVSKFYAEQCRYFSEQHNRLIARVKVVREKAKLRKVMRTRSNSGSSDSESVENAQAPKKSSESDSDSGLEPVSPTEKKKVTAKELDHEKSKLRLLFRQIYNAVRMLEDYRSINELAFIKITKKHDKNSGLFRNLRSITRQLISGECNFGSDNFTKFLRRRLEYLYSMYLKPSDHTTSQAIERLRHPPSDQSVQTESFVIGLCGGWSIAIASACIALVATLAPHEFWRDQSVNRAWYMFTAAVLVSVYMWLWGCDLWVFQKYQFNHAFIFGADPTTLMRVPNIWNIAAILSVTTMLFSFFFALAYLDPATFNFNPEIFAMIGFFIGFLYILAPIPALEKRKTKRFLRRSLWRQIRSPFSRVEFIDFFLADQWCSLFSLLDDLAFTACFTITGDFIFSKEGDDSQCESLLTKAWLHMLKITPYWIRFWQCIHRAYDKHRRNGRIHWHLANAGKYATAVIVVVINSYHIYHDNGATEGLAVGFGAIATLYAYSWDIYKDWGLLRWKENKEHKLLRKELTYPASAYYIAMIVNFMLRIAWAVALYPAAFGINNDHMMHFVGLPLSMAEIGRRCMWNVFRLENEHLNNCGEFRVVKDIPLIRSDSVRSIKIEIDLNPMEGDDVKLDTHLADESSQRMNHLELDHFKMNHYDGGSASVIRSNPQSVSTPAHELNTNLSKAIDIELAEMDKAKGDDDLESVELERINRKITTNSQSTGAVSSDLQSVDMKPIHHDETKSEPKQEYVQEIRKLQQRIRELEGNINHSDHSGKGNVIVDSKMSAQRTGSIDLVESGDMDIVMKCMNEI